MILRGYKLSVQALIAPELACNYSSSQKRHHVDTVFNGFAQKCVDPLNFCSGVIFDVKTDEHEDGRRRQTLDDQAQSGIGHGNHAG